MNTTTRLFSSRFRHYLLLICSQTFLVWAGIVGSACDEASSPTTTWQVPDTNTAHPDGGVYAGSGALSTTDVIFPKTTKLPDGSTAEVTWSLSNSGDAVAVPFRQSNGDVKLSIARGGVKSGQSTTVKMVGTYVTPGGKRMSVTEYLPVHAR